MNTAITLPTFDDLANAQVLVDIQEEHETLKAAMTEWLALVSDFIAQAEACNFTDELGHPLANNAAYVALKASVAE